MVLRGSGHKVGPKLQGIGPKLQKDPIWTQNLSLGLTGRLVGELDEAAWPWYERVKGTKKSALVEMETVVSNSTDEEIYKRIKTKKAINKFSISGENKSEEERTSKGQECSEIKTNSWSSYDKTKNGEYMC